MCTLTFIPQKNGYLFTSNRDEQNTRRKAARPELTIQKDRELLFPRDGEAGGTWIVSSQNRDYCLLNGAFSPHERNTPYRRSRGLVLLDAILCQDLLTFNNEYNLSGIEPFTIVAICNIENLLQEFRWDGQHRHLSELDFDKPAIWSSSTLYSPEVRKKREQWFSEFLAENPEPGAEDILDFHRFTEDENADHGLVMKRGPSLQTLSISCLQRDPNGLLWYHQDLLDNTEERIRAFENEAPY